MNRTGRPQFQIQRRFRPTYHWSDHLEWVVHYPHRRRRSRRLVVGWIDKALADRDRTSGNKIPACLGERVKKCILKYECGRGTEEYTRRTSCGNPTPYIFTDPLSVILQMLILQSLSREADQQSPQVAKALKRAEPYGQPS